MCKPRGSLVGIAVKVGAGVATATMDVTGMYFGLIVEVLGIGMTDDVVMISVSVTYSLNYITKLITKL